MWIKAKHLLDHKSLHISYCSLVLPYLNNCAEVWGNNYKGSLGLYSLIILQKRTIRIIHSVRYRDHTNTLFLESKLLKFIDLMEPQTTQILYKTKNISLSPNVQEVFCNRDGDYNLRRKCN